MSAEQEPYVLFELAGSLYGIPSRSVQHIEIFEHATPVPNAHRAIDGVVFSRGQVFPALNLRARFGFERQEKTLRTRLIFVTVHDRTVGLIVDNAREFLNVPSARIHPIETTLTGVNKRCLKAVTKIGERLVLILDLEAVLNVDQGQLLEQAQPRSPQAAAP